MKTSDTQKALLAALFKAKQEFPRIAKLKKGQSGNRTFNYAPLDAINDNIDPVLWRHNLIITHGIDGHCLTTRLEHIESGEWREICMPVNAEHANMQSYGIEVTYRRRYSVPLLLGIVTEEDIDIKSKERSSGKDHTGKDDGQGIRISPAEEAYKAACTVIPERRRSELDEAAMIAVEYFNAGNTSKCLSVVRAISDNEEKVYVNWQLRAESKLRAFLKANQRVAA